MKLFSFLIACFWLTKSVGQLKNPDSSHNINSIDLILSSSRDTLVMGKKMFVNATIRNNSNEPVLIPKKYNLISNLYPFGYLNDRIFRGGLFQLTIDTVINSPIHTIIEETQILKEEEFITINPEMASTFNIDIGNHINSYNNQVGLDRPKIIKEKTYTLQLKFFNRDSDTTHSIKGPLESNTLKVFIK